MELNAEAREVSIKLVYYGPALSGKTTNLRSLNARAREESRGRLMSLDTNDERTLFFDLLPIVVRPGTTSAFALRVQLFTVPGQALHAAARRLVLRGADGVAFVADSSLSEIEHTALSFRDFTDSMQAEGREQLATPVVIQFNKRDLPNVRSEEEIRALARKGREPVVFANAAGGEGVLETFAILLDRAWRSLDGAYSLESATGLSRVDVLEAAAAAFGVEEFFSMLASELAEFPEASS